MQNTVTIGSKLQFRVTFLHRVFYRCYFFHLGGKIIFVYAAYLSLSDQHAGCHVNTGADVTGILTIDLSGGVITVLNCLITCLCHVIPLFNSPRWICRHEITMRNYLFIPPLYSHYRFSLSF